MKYLFQSLLIVFFFISCDFIKNQKVENTTKKVIASVNNHQLFLGDIAVFFPKKIHKKDSIVLAKSLIQTWATKQILLKRAEENNSLEENKKIKQLVKDYRESLLINNYKKSLIKQRLDTVISQDDIEEYYAKNNKNFKLNEDLIKVRHVHFGNDLIEKKEVINLFKSDEIEDLEDLEKKHLSFKSHHLNDSTWVRLENIMLKVPFSKENLLKKTKFIQKQDSLGLYLVSVKDVLLRNNLAPLSYIKPSIKQMILHKRKIELIRNIEKIIVKDATQNKNFRTY